jgi:hypothetical protein
MYPYKQMAKLLFIYDAIKYLRDESSQHQVNLNFTFING